MYIVVKIAIPMAAAAMLGLIGFCRIAAKMASGNDPHTITDTDQLA